MLQAIGMQGLISCGQFSASSAASCRKAMPVPLRQCHPSQAVRAARQLCVVASRKRDSQEKIKQARTSQIQATDMLARLLQAGDQEAVAREHVDSLTEDFFTMSNVYLEMAKREGETEVIGKLEQAMRVAMAEKQKMLRPEIQLLNNLLACKSPAERQKIFDDPETPSILTMNDRYFFKNMLDRMITDVEKGQNPAQKQLLHQLREVKEEAELCAST